MSIGIVIPTFGRAPKLGAVYADVEQGTRHDHAVYFAVEATDVESIEAVRALGLEPVINQHTANYAGACNTVYEQTTDEFLFCGADDLHFHPRWDDEALAVLADQWLGVSGTNDCLNPYVAQGTHATHSLVRRAYLDQVGGTVDGGPGSWLHEGYGHNYTDTEFIGTAKARAKFHPCFTSIVEHMHHSAGRSVHDATHAKADASYGADSALYDARRELWFSLSR